MSVAESGPARSTITLVTWTEAIPGSAELLAAVFRLHRRAKATLGKMPDAAFRDRGPTGGLVLAMDGDQVVGYTLFDRPRQSVKLIHVCVDPELRRSGVARLLVDHVAEVNAGRLEMTAACRADYNLDGFWRSAGMHPRSEKRGRSLSGVPLTNWVRPLGQPDLLESMVLDSGRPLAVLDTNIVSDLYASPAAERPGRRESEALLADWLESEVAFAISTEVDFELQDIADQTERQHQRAAAQHLSRLRSSRPADSSVEDALLDRIAPDAVARDASLASDVKHLADAINAGARYFITNDSNLINQTAGWLHEDWSVVIVRPHQLIRDLAHDEGAQMFESRLIDSIDLVWEPVESTAAELEVAFLSYDRGERSSAFTRRVRELLAAHPRTMVSALRDPEGGLWALAATHVDGTTLTVPLLRAARRYRGATVSFQLTRWLRKRARAAHCTTVTVTDPALSETMQSALRDDGFDVDDESGAPFTGRLLDVVARAEELVLPDGHRLPAIPSAEEVKAAERRYWPLTITGTPTPTYMVPIWPRYAEKLFGFTQALTPEQRRGLGLSRELVYFFGSLTRMSAGPARLLWYVTKDDLSEERLVVATSRLIESRIMTPEDAHARFGHLGVLTKKEIFGAASKKGDVHVIRFEDTELLDHPLGRGGLRPILNRHGAMAVPYSLRKVPPGVFDDVIEQTSARGRERD